MATTPVPVQQGVPAPANTQDVWRSLRTEMDRLFDRFYTGFSGGPFLSGRLSGSVTLPSPAVDITEDESTFKISAELPGLTEKDIQISVSGDTLSSTFRNFISLAAGS
jgi:HSP20 family protein